MNAIRTAVGPTKPNAADDVRTVQHLLNQHISELALSSRLAEDGQFGAKTAAAILQFQSKALHIGKPDGVVDPGGSTWKALCSVSPAHHPDPPHVTAFINRALPSARQVKTKWNVPIAVILAQSAQETGWGRKVVNNAYFGIKGRAPSGNSTDFQTTEVVNGKVIHIKAQFRAYRDYADAADDYGRFLNENTRYRSAFASKKDPIKFVEEIARAGYATDPQYAKSLASIIRSHHLEQYDQ